MKTSEKTGELVGALTLGDDDELMLMSSTGQMIRIKANGIRLAGRNTQGVKLVDLSPKEFVIAIAPVRNEEDGEASDGENDDEIENQNENENEAEIISSEEESSTLADESDDGASSDES